MIYTVSLRKCCPTATMILEVSENSEANARKKALKHANKGRRLVWKGWKISNVREKAHDANC